MSFAVADLHCDLPLYLAIADQMGEERSVHDRKSRCAVPQMREGGVEFQAFAIFSPPAEGSGDFGLRQAEHFAGVLESHTDIYRWARSVETLTKHPGDDRIGAMVAIEGGDAFANPGEPLDDALARLDTFRQAVGPVIYTSLTWVTENRFGGGNGSDKGLLDDGRVLLEYLAEHRVPVDLSHASPKLAHDLLNFTYARGLDMPILASHSPYAGVKDIPRNLTDEAAKEIAARDGVIGLNVMCRYLDGDAPQSFVDQMTYARQLGVLGAQALGADYFCDLDVPPEFRNNDDPDFYEDFGNSSCYPRLLEAVQEGLGLTDDELAAIAHGNAFRFARRALAGQES